MALLQVKQNEYEMLKKGSQLEASNEISMGIVYNDFKAGTININFLLSGPTKLILWIG